MSRRWRVALALLVPALRGWFATVSVRRLGRRRVDALRAAGAPMVFASLHSDLVLLLASHRGDPCVALVSQSRDGDALTALLQGLGTSVVRGSSSRGGSAGVRALIRAAGQGRAPTLAVDGPRGPAGSVAPGAAAVAQWTGAWLIPVRAVAWPAIRLGSWDRTVLPLPGARVWIRYGRPTQIAADESLETANADLQRRFEALAGWAAGWRR